MAIKVNGTTVINDSRTLQNVGGLKTVNGTSIVGSGNISAGASTTVYAVGTYICAKHNQVSGELVRGDTTSGSNLGPCNLQGSVEGSFPSGTWRTMGYSLKGSGGDQARATIFVRIS
jgi:hypothetical protein